MYLVHSFDSIQIYFKTKKDLEIFDSFNHFL